MTKLTTIILLLISHLVSGQNLVPNPSFETYSLCPSWFTNYGDDQVSRATGWSSLRETPDYFNKCAPPVVSCPGNDVGYQPPHTGNGYCGVATFDRLGGLYREIIGRQLSSPLVLGTKYFVSFYASLAVKGSFVYATNRIGLKFMTTPSNYTSNPIPITNFCQINHNTFITDSTNWTRVMGSFVADSSYKYIAIGNFYDDANTDTVCIQNVQNRFNAYYYVDDVCVSIDSNYTATWSGIKDISNYNNVKIDLYPNPSSKNVSLVFNNLKQENYTLAIYNIQGRLIQTQEIIAVDKIELEIKNFTSGLYFIHLLTKDEIKATSKLLVE